MTLPASGPISTAQILSELGQSPPLVIPSSAVRTLTGVASGPIVMPTDFHGKTKSGGAPSYNATAAPTLAKKGQIGTPITSPTVSCAVAGGTGPFTYLWQNVSGDVLTITNSTNSSTTFSGSPGSGQQLEGVYRCRVRDTGNSNAEDFSNNVTIRLTETTPV